MDTKLVYVKSGELEVKLEANHPMQAIKRALDRSGGATLDPCFFYLDERGFRTTTAEYKVPVEQALAEAGYKSGPDGLFTAED